MPCLLLTCYCWQHYVEDDGCKANFVLQALAGRPAVQLEGLRTLPDELLEREHRALEETHEVELALSTSMLNEIDRTEAAAEEERTLALA